MKSQPLSRRTWVMVMAVAKSGKGCNEERKGPGKMSSKKATSLGSIVKARLANESQDEIIERSHNLACVSNGHARGIFFQGEIAAIV